MIKYKKLKILLKVIIQNKVADYFEVIRLNEIKSSNVNLKKYFGRKSIGKSITLIGTLKYMYDHSWYNTFYINCERIEYYSRKN